MLSYLSISRKDLLVVMERLQELNYTLNAVLTDCCDSGYVHGDIERAINIVDQIKKDLEEVK